MSKMNNKPRNWYLDLQSLASKDEKAAEYLTKYKEAKNEVLKEEIKSYMSSLKEGPAENPVEDSVEASESDAKPEIKTKSELDLNSITEEYEKILSKKRVLMEEVNRLEHCRLKDETYEQRKKLNSEIFEIQQKIYLLNSRRRDLVIQKRRLQNVVAGKISGTNIKRAMLLKEIVKGTSLSNIVKSGKLMARELTDLIEGENFIKKIEEKKKQFPPMWYRWKKKFLTQKKGV